MKTWGLVLLLFCSLAKADPALLGEWKLVQMIYRGSEIPLPNPDLNLRWTFFSNGTERLYWDRGQTSFCERFAHFQLQDGLLRETVFSLNPQNSPECQKDPDMQLGRQTQTKLEVEAQELRLHFQLGDEELIYVLKETD